MFIHAAIFLLVINHVELKLLVHTEVGSIHGVPADDGDYVMFLGIPYAKVNTSNPFGVRTFSCHAGFHARADIGRTWPHAGDRMFQSACVLPAGQASIPYEKFDKVFEAFAESPICPQMREQYDEANGDPYDGTLDCLRLNVFVPNTETKNKAVYLYMFGGKFNRGISERSSYGPKYLVRHDIIVVTFNYRLGPYGFMCMDIPEIPGNQGLWDQYKAIKWVRDNIRAFGGDPDKITIGGHSSGAMGVDMNLLTKQPRLFQQAIIQSGTATHSGFIKASDTMSLINIANKIGFETNDTYAALSFLAKESPETVIKATANEYEWMPCIEKEFEGVVPFIVENPELSEGTNIDGLNILGGFTDKECLHCLYRSIFKQTFSQPDVFRYVLNKKFNFKNDTSNVVDTSMVNHFYLEDDRNRETYKYQIVDFLSDFYFEYPVQRQLIKYTKHRNTNVYLYMFSYDGRLNRMKRLYNVTKAGATHSDELAYIFTMDFIPDIPNSDDQRIIDQLTTLWTNFVKYGNPTPRPTELLPVTWPPLTADTVPYLQIDTSISVVSRPFRKSTAFWDLFFDAHLDKLRY